MTVVRVAPAGRVEGTLRVPGDKSISHRALILGSLARGRSYLSGLSPAADVESTAACLRACAADVRPFGDGRVSLDGDGVGASLRAPAAPLQCGNSGSTMRLLCGLLAGHDLAAALDGDASLRRRPMERVAAPLRAMGAEVETAAGRPPLVVRGRDSLRAITYRSPVASAQLKSAVLLAGLRAEGVTTVVEPAASRDHTERLLRMCGVTVAAGALGGVALTPGPLAPFGLRVPGDLSSAAFALALAAALPGSALRCPGVTLNPGRTGFLDVLVAMGAEVTVEEGEPAGGVEPQGDVEVRAAPLHGAVVGGDLVPRCIDELPVLAVLAAVAEGTTVIRDAAELRVKESDRIAAIAAGLRALGARVEEAPDGLAVTGPARLRPARLESGGDHRLAMAWAVAGMLAAGGATEVGGMDAVAVSYPGFIEDLAAVVRA